MIHTFELVYNDRLDKCENVVWRMNIVVSGFSGPKVWESSINSCNGIMCTSGGVSSLCIIVS